MAKNQEEFLHTIRNAHSLGSSSHIEMEIGDVIGFDVLAQRNQNQSPVPLTALRIACTLQSQGRKDLLLDIDPYSLLVLAQKIQQKLDPVKHSQ